MKVFWKLLPNSIQQEVSHSFSVFLSRKQIFSLKPHSKIQCIDYRV